MVWCRSYAVFIVVNFGLLISPRTFNFCLASNVDRNFSFYNEIQSINGTDSLCRIAKLPIVYYKFLYDSVPDRLQLGVIGPEAQKLFPEAVEVLSSTAFSTSAKDPASPKRFTPPTIVTSFPVIDKSVLFMHGLAAIQELVVRYSTLESKLLQYSKFNSLVVGEIESFQEYLHQDISEHALNDIINLKLKDNLTTNRIKLQLDSYESEQQKLSMQLVEEKKLLDYEETLSRNRLIAQEKYSQNVMLQQMALEKELLNKKEFLNSQSQQKLVEERMKRIKEIDEQKLAFERERISGEIEAKEKVEKMNEAISIRKLQMTSRLETERFIQSIKSVSFQLSKLIQDAISHPQQLAVVIGVIIVMIGIFFCIRELATVIRQLIQSTIGRPVLVRETSSRWNLQILFANFFPLRSSDIKSEFDDIILSSDDKSRVLELAIATRNTKKSGAPFRHVLLHGPPGTGKVNYTLCRIQIFCFSLCFVVQTLIARRLAKCSGLEYAFMSGGDISVLGEDSVSQLHSLFRWARNSSNGLVLFIDEAEAFLCSRSNFNGDMTSENHVRNALNALLYQTGTPSKSFMMVLATNRPEDLDPAILDRIDVSIKIGLPRERQRIELVDLYMNRYLKELNGVNSFWVHLFRLLGMKHNEEIRIDAECLQYFNIRIIAKKTAGFSGREIAKLLISVQYAVMLSEHKRLSMDVLQDITEAKIFEHNLKTKNFQIPDLQNY